MGLRSADWTRRRLLVMGTSLPFAVGCASRSSSGAIAPVWRATTEFEPQKAIWVTWGDAGFLGGSSMMDTMIPVLKEITPEVRVRLLYNAWTSWQEQMAMPDPPRTATEMRLQISRKLEAEGIDRDRIDFQESPFLFGAIQDPGPVFLRAPDHGLGIADFASAHPLPLVGGLDRMLTEYMGIPAISSDMVSDGGNR